MKRDIIRESLADLDRRNRERAILRALKRAEYLERRRTGRTREYEVSKWKRA